MIKERTFKTLKDLNISVKSMERKGYTCKEIHTNRRRFFNNDNKALSYINTKSKKILTYIYL